jgi:hypothetical protein
MAALDAAGSHLRACQLCWLATDGPHGLTCCTLYYALPEPWCLLVMSSSRPRHVANLKPTPPVLFAYRDYPQASESQRDS